MPHIKLTAAALAILALAAASPAGAQHGNSGDDVLVGGRTSYDTASKPGASGHAGGVNVLMGDGSVRFNQPSGGGTSAAMGDGSVRGLRGDIGGGGWHAPKTGSLNSLNSVGSIGQLAAPPGAPPAQATNNIKQLGLASHNYDTSQNGDGKDGPDIIVGTGIATHVKTFNGTANAGPKGGAAHVKAFSGADSAARGSGPGMKTVGGGGTSGVNIGGATATFTLDKQGKTTK